MADEHVNEVADGAVRLAVLGDIHLYRLWCAPWRMLSKRLLGQVNLWFKRRRHFDRDLLPDVLSKISSLGADMLLLTGDVSTTALADEFKDVKREIESLGDQPMIGVPGNHDRYTFSAMRNKTMEAHLPGLIPATFPHIQPISKQWQILMIDASVPRFVTARGKVGTAQLEKTKSLLDAVPENQGVVVVCHYPLLHPEGKEENVQHRLEDLQELRDVLCQCKPRIVYVHGHVHYPWCMLPPHDVISYASRDGAGEPSPKAFDRIIDLNVGAPCMRHRDFPVGEGFWQIDLPAAADGEIVFSHHVPRRDTVEGPITWVCNRTVA